MVVTLSFWRMYMKRVTVLASPPLKVSWHAKKIPFFLLTLSCTFVHTACRHITKWKGSFPEKEKAVVLKTHNNFFFRNIFALTSTSLEKNNNFSCMQASPAPNDQWGNAGGRGARVSGAFFLTGWERVELGEEDSGPLAWGVWAFDRGGVQQANST